MLSKAICFDYFENIVHEIIVTTFHLTLNQKVAYIIGVVIMTKKDCILTVAGLKDVL